MASMTEGYQRPGMRHYVVATVCEGDYDLGVGAMVNSLYRVGYRGKVVVGYRGRPPHLPTECGLDTHGAQPEIEIEAVPVEYRWHLCNYKPHLLRALLDRADQTWDGVVFADPDIVFRAPWPFIAAWLGHGVALCGDRAYHRMEANDPKRAAWRDLAACLGHSFRERIGYANSGFVGVDRRHRSLLDAWIDLEAQLATRGLYDRSYLSNSHSAYPFEWADQDVLNMALHLADVPVALAGLEGMGFDDLPIYYMSHAVSRPKPWRWHLLRDALRHGRRPSRATRDFWAHVNHPIPVFPRWRRALAKAEIKASVAVARVLG